MCARHYVVHCNTRQRRYFARVRRCGAAKLLQCTSCASARAPQAPWFQCRRALTRAEVSKTRQKLPDTSYVGRKLMAPYRLRGGIFIALPPLTRARGSFPFEFSFRERGRHLEVPQGLRYTRHFLRLLLLLLLLLLLCLFETRANLEHSRRSPIPAFPIPFQSSVIARARRSNEAPISALL